MCVPLEYTSAEDGTIISEYFLRKRWRFNAILLSIYLGLCLAVPGIFLYVAGVPAATLLVLFRRRHKLFHRGEKGKETRETFGFLCRLPTLVLGTSHHESQNWNGLRRYFWPSAFGAYASASRTSCRRLCDWLSYHHETILSQTLQNMERLSLTVSLITLYLGMFFFSNDSTWAIKTLITSIICIMNAAFAVKLGRKHFGSKM